VIFQDQDLVKAENKKERAIDFSSSNASLVINQAINQGNDIYIEGGNYSLTSNIHIFNREDVRITSNKANLTCNGNKIIIKGDSYTKSQRNLLSGLKIINGTVRIENSFRTTVSHMFFENCRTALELTNTATWSEATTIEDCQFDNCTQGIIFRTPTNEATGSYAGTKIKSCYFNLRDNSTGITIEPEAKYNDGYIQGGFIWIGKYGKYNQTGILVAGSMYQTQLLSIVFESFANPPVYNLYGIAIENTTDPAPVIDSSVTWNGNWTARVHNRARDIWIPGGVFKITNRNVTVGLNDQYEEPENIKVRPFDIALFEAKIRVQSSFGHNETVTVRFRLEFVDHSISDSVEKTFNESAELWLDKDDILKLFPSQNVIWAILVDAKTDSEATDAIVQIDVVGAIN